MPPSTRGFDIAPVRSQPGCWRDAWMRAPRLSGFAAGRCHFCRSFSRILGPPNVVCELYALQRMRSTARKGCSEFEREPGSDEDEPTHTVRRQGGRMARRRHDLPAVRRREPAPLASTTADDGPGAGRSAGAA